MSCWIKSFLRVDGSGVCLINCLHVAMAFSNSSVDENPIKDWKGKQQNK